MQLTVSRGVADFGIQGHTKQASSATINIDPVIERGAAEHRNHRHDHERAHCTHRRFSETETGR